MASNTTNDSFKIRLIHDVNNSSRDDLITIDPIWTTINDEINVKEFKIQMKYAKYPATTTNMLGNMTYNYIQTLLTLLPQDEDGYECIQVDMPLIPSIIVHTNKLNNIIYHILFQFQMIQNNWPIKVVEPTRKVVEPTRKNVAPTHTDAARIHTPVKDEGMAGARRHLFFDEDGDVSQINVTYFT